MQDVERVARCRKGSCQRHNSCMYAPCFAVPLFTVNLTPDTAISHALHAGEDVGYARGWNAAIDELERQDGFGEWAEAAKFLRTLKPTR